MPAAVALAQSPRSADERLQALMNAHPEPIDPRAAEVALMRLRDAPDEELAVFADRLREDARRAGASEQEVREAQAAHPQH